MPHPYTPPPHDPRPRRPGAPGPKPAVISRDDTIAELRAIYRLLNHHDIPRAKSRLTMLGRNLQTR